MEQTMTLVAITQTSNDIRTLEKEHLTQDALILQLQKSCSHGGYKLPKSSQQKWIILTALE